MKQVLGPVLDAWRSDEFTNSVSSFEPFCGLMGMDRLPEFLSTNNFAGVQDWTGQPLPSDGNDLQKSIEECFNVSPLPPRGLCSSYSQVAALTPTIHEGLARSFH